MVDVLPAPCAGTVPVVVHVLRFGENDEQSVVELCPAGDCVVQETLFGEYDEQSVVDVCCERAAGASKTRTPRSMVERSIARHLGCRMQQSMRRAHHSVQIRPSTAIAPAQSSSREFVGRGGAAVARGYSMAIWRNESSRAPLSRALVRSGPCGLCFFSLHTGCGRGSTAPARFGKGFSRRARTRISDALTREWKVRSALFTALGAEPLRSRSLRKRSPARVAMDTHRRTSGGSIARCTRRHDASSETKSPGSNTPATHVRTSWMSDAS